MSGWQSHTGKAVCLAQDNIDTDQLIPARFMSQPRASGYGDFLLHDMRHDINGHRSSSFILNRVTDASVLVTGRNFGSGSSREAAVYALLDAGIRVVIASSFGDIFVANAINNGLLAAQASEDGVKLLRSTMGRHAADVHVSLNTQTITLNRPHSKVSLHFSIDNSQRTKLMKGWDDIDLTLQQADSIKSFRKQHAQRCAWAFAIQQES